MSQHRWFHVAKVTGDPVLDAILPHALEQCGYKILSYDERGEFPDGCVAARIGGPGLPPNGLPFCVPSVGRDVWAGRILLVISDAYLRGVEGGV
jgi:hypothetical protein